MQRCVPLVLLAQSATATVQWWQTAKDTDDRLSKQHPLEFEARTDDDGATTILLDPSQNFQSIFGFGGAFTQSAATVWQQMSKLHQVEVIEAYYGKTGIGYTTGRVPIHSCDFSTDIYTFDDHAGDYNLTYFDDSVAHDTNLSIPFIAMALKAHSTAFNSSIRLFGSPWSPPAWMKDNNDMEHGGVLLEEAKPAWAKYFSRWIDSYQAQGVPLWGVTVQNEPEAVQPWESCIFTPETQGSFVSKYLGPTLKQDHPDIKILGYDHNKDHIVEWADTLTDMADEYIDGVAFHWYSGSCFENVAQVSARHPDKILLPTEACYELTVLDKEETRSKDFVSEGTWARGEGYAHDILGDLNAGAMGWTDWNLMLDQQGGPNHVGNFCDAPILVDTTVDGGELHFHPQYWYIGHFSKFLLKQSKRIAVDVSTYVPPTNDCSGWPAYGLCPAGGLESTAFLRPDGKLAVVVMNCADDAVKVALAMADNSDSVVYNTVPAHSIQTYIL